MKTILFLWISVKFMDDKGRTIISISFNVYMSESLPALAGSKLYFEAPEINSGTQNKLAQPTGWGNDFLQSRKS